MNDFKEFNLRKGKFVDFQNHLFKVIIIDNFKVYSEDKIYFELPSGWENNDIQLFANHEIHDI